MRELCILFGKIGETEEYCTLHVLFRIKYYFTISVEYKRRILNPYRTVNLSLLGPKVGLRLWTVDPLELVQRIENSRNQRSEYSIFINNHSGLWVDINTQRCNTGVITSPQIL